MTSVDQVTLLSMTQSIDNEPPRVLKVALVQMCPKTLEPEHNFNTARDYIVQAASQGAHLAVLPEYHLTGWAPDDPQFHAIARQAPNYLSRYQDLAKTHNICIVPGTIVTHDSTTSHLLNQTHFISSTGVILGSYTKLNLWHPERTHLTSAHTHRLHSTPPPSNCPPPAPRTHHTPIETPLGPIGLLICYDLFFPESARQLARSGARLIIIPTFTLLTDPSPAVRTLNPHAEALFATSALVTRAFENTCAIVFVNPGGEVDEGYMGLSRAVVPITGVVEGSFEDARVGMKVVEVDFGVVEEAERNWRIREDLGREGFHY